MIYLDKLGWPIERIRGRHVQNFIRLLIHTRKIVRHWEDPGLASGPSHTASQEQSP